MMIVITNYSRTEWGSMFSRIAWINGSILLQDDRLSILQALGRKLVLSDDIDLKEIADNTEGFTGADLQSLLYTALIKAVEQTFTPSGECC